MHTLAIGSELAKKTFSFKLGFCMGKQFIISHPEKYFDSHNSKGDTIAAIEFFQWGYVYRQPILPSQLAIYK